MPSGVIIHLLQVHLSEGLAVNLGQKFFQPLAWQVLHRDEGEVGSFDGSQGCRQSQVISLLCEAQAERMEESELAQSDVCM